MTMGCPQQGQTIGGLGFGAGGSAGLAGNSTCNKAISRLRFWCRKPKLRARREPVMRFNA
jgi:hypothetical protein